MAFIPSTGCPKTVQSGNLTEVTFSAHGTAAENQGGPINFPPGQSHLLPNSDSHLTSFIVEATDDQRQTVRITFTNATVYTDRHIEGSFSMSGKGKYHGLSGSWK